MFLDAVVNGDTKKIKELLAIDPDMALMRDGKGKGGIGSPVLCVAIQNGHGDIVEMFLSWGADPNEKDISGRTSLHLAARKGDPKLIELLLKHGIDVNVCARDLSSSIPLCHAGSRQAAEILIANGADLSWRDESGGTVLHSLVRRGTIDAAKVIIEHGVDVNAQNNFGSMALHVIAEHGSKEMAEVIVAKGANLNIKDNKGFTPLARKMKFVNGFGAYAKDFAEFLIRSGAQYTINDVAWLGDLVRFSELLENDPAFVDYVNSLDREPVLFAAIYGGNSDIFKLLLTKGARLDVRGKHRESPLFAASYIGNSYALRILLEKGLDVNERGIHGESALHWAAVKGNTEAVLLLLKAGADVTAKVEYPALDLDMRYGNTPNAIVMKLKDLQSLESQRQARLAGRSIQIAVHSKLAILVGDTPLHSASLWGHGEIVKILLSHGAVINAKNHFGQQPLHYACVFRSKEVVKILLDAGADANAKDDDGHTPVGLASFPKGNPAKDIVEMLRAKGGRK
jgi:cytohesin